MIPPLSERNGLPTKLFIVDPAAEPHDPNLTHKLSQELEGTVPTVQFDTARPTSGDLLLGVPNGEHNVNAVVFQAMGGVTRPNQKDIEAVIDTLTNSETGVGGNVHILFKFLEGRDDEIPRKKGPRGPSQVKRDVGDLLNAANVQESETDQNESALGELVVWESHSPILLAELQSRLFGKNSSPHVHAMTAVSLFTDKFKKRGIGGPNTIVLSADIGALERSVRGAHELEAGGIIFADKSRPAVNNAHVEGFYQLHPDGSVTPLAKTFLQGKEAVVFEDIVDTGKTLFENLMPLRIDRVFFGATHGIFSFPAASERILSAFDEHVLTDLYTTDSLPTHQNIPHPNIHTVSIVPTTASLVRVLAGQATTEDSARIQQSLFSPTHTKQQLLYEFGQNRFSFPRNGIGEKGEMILTFENAPLLQIAA